MGGTNLVEEDRISELPDDILVRILSLLSMKEAGITSVLSKRWEHVWSYVPDLYFDASDKIVTEKLWTKKTYREQEVQKYLRWVDQVVSTHKAPTIDEFRVWFRLDATLSSHIDDWIRFASEKGVKRLLLSFTNYEGSRHKPAYSFTSTSFKSLTTLQLNYVEVTGQVLEKLLYESHCLEYLSVSQSESLVSLKVIGQSLRLKSLRFSYCKKLTDLEISAPNLVSVHYKAIKSGMPFSNTPNLTELSIDGLFNTYLTNGLPQDLLSFISRQFQVLRLTTPCYTEAIRRYFPVCPRLKLLDVRIYRDEEDDDTLHYLTSLIKACPSLHKLMISFIDYGTSGRGTGKRARAEACPHYHLKIVEIDSFTGWESRFIKYLAKNIISLEKMIIDPRYSKGQLWEYSNSSIKRTIKARKKARQVHRILKPWTKLEIL